jgi:hypothetical protein
MVGRATGRGLTGGPFVVKGTSTEKRLKKEEGPMQKLAIALMIILVLPLVFVPAATADMFFPMRPGDVFTFSVSNHADKHK